MSSSSDQILLHLRDLKNRLPASLAGDIRSLRTEVSRNTADLQSLRTAVFGLSGLQSQLAELRGRSRTAEGSNPSAWSGLLSALPPRVLSRGLGVAGLLGLVLIVALALAGELGTSLAAVGGTTP